jgi:putative lipoic acid-binding regulatory protein
MEFLETLELLILEEEQETEDLVEQVEVVLPVALEDLILQEDLVEHLVQVFVPQVVAEVVVIVVPDLVVEDLAQQLFPMGEYLAAAVAVAVAALEDLEVLVRLQMELMVIQVYLHKDLLEYPEQEELLAILV